MEVDRATLRTRALFEAEALLREIEARGHTRVQVRYLKRATDILRNYPTRFELMHLAEEHPMLDAAEAQRLGCVKEKLEPSADVVAEMAKRLEKERARKR